MDDKPMWVADHVVALTPSSAITIPKTINEFSIKVNHLTLVKGNQFNGRTKTDPHKHIHEFLRICDMFKYRDTKNEVVRLMIRFFSPALFDRLLGEIRAFSQHENESLTDAWLRMKEMLRNCHGHNLSKGNIIKIFYHGLNEITQEVLNAAARGPDKTDTDKIIARMDAMKIKIDAQYKELQSRTKQPKPDLDDIPMSREEEAKFMQSFHSKVSLILGRPFLHTADAVIRVKQKQLNLRVGSERMIFNDYAIKHSYSNDDTCFNIDVIDEILEEDYDLLDEGSRILYSIKGTVLGEEIFAEFDEFMAMTADENSESESDTEEPPFEKNHF
ncbi:reverse transcriptase domain-containing protein [Tanacetum coccineum]